MCGLDNEILLCDVNIAESQQHKSGSSGSKGHKRKADGADAATAGHEGDHMGPVHAPLPETSKLRLSHHRFIFPSDFAFISCL